MTLEDKVHATRLLALQRAEGLGKVSAACRELGISRIRRLGEPEPAGTGKVDIVR